LPKWINLDAGQVWLEEMIPVRKVQIGGASGIATNIFPILNHLYSDFWSLCFMSFTRFSKMTSG
jgi:hypothetical protein